MSFTGRTAKTLNGLNAEYKYDDKIYVVSISSEALQDVAQGDLSGDVEILFKNAVHTFDTITSNKISNNDVDHNKVHIFTSDLN